MTDNEKLQIIKQWIDEAISQGNKTVLVMAIKSILLEQMAEQNEQLKQAKEHIQTLISCLIDWVQVGDKDYCYIADAVQFLKENE